MNKINLIVTSTFGLEAVVKRELQAMGFHGFTVADGKVEFEAGLEAIPRLNIGLRVADRVLVKLGEFPATDFGQLFDRTRALPWEQWLTPDAKMTVTGKSVRSQLASVRSCQSIAHKAVVERLKEGHKTAILPETGPAYTIQVSLFKDTAQLTLDTSGYGLHKRGYRAATGEVPLRENLAAALVLLSGWEKGLPLMDPMCGSGTILIEAAMIARNIAPGLARDFAAEHWPVVPQGLWDTARRAAREVIRPSGGLDIRGYDHDPQRIQDARTNAQNAGVDQDIAFELKDIKDLRINPPQGQVITNPPYGVKLGSSAPLASLYTALQKALKPVEAGWAVGVLTADKQFPQAFRRVRPERVRKLFNGTLEAHYFQYPVRPSS